MASTTDYTALVTSEYAQSQNFLAMITADVSVQVQVQNLLASMIPIFDLATPPVGNQLDIIGQWVGVSRNISVPIPGVFFSWNGTAAVGWSYGSWQPPDAPANITVLPDDAYLTLILARIAANNWDGTTAGAYTIWASLFTSFQILIQDYENMKYALAFVGGTVDSLTLALITRGYIDLRPEGVQITKYFIGPPTGPVFSWGSTASIYLGGWGIGSWATEVLPT